MAETSNRWWEFYFVRYFVGTVVGTILTLFLFINGKSGINTLITGSNFEEIIKSFSTSHLIVFGLVGLSFCYISSSPILVFHGFRATFFVLFNKSLNKENKGFSKWIALLICILPLAIAYYHIGFKTFMNLEEWIIILFMINLIQIILIVTALWTGASLIYYDKLSEMRAKGDKVNTEYIESYRHLREHGNAFLIILMELAFTFILYNINEFSKLIWVLFIWIFPAAIVWMLGTLLEYKKILG